MAASPSILLKYDGLCKKHEGALEFLRVTNVENEKHARLASKARNRFLALWQRELQDWVQLAEASSLAILTMPSCIVKVDNLCKQLFSFSSWSWIA